MVLLPSRCLGFSDSTYKEESGNTKVGEFLRIAAKFVLGLFIQYFNVITVIVIDDTE